MTVLAIELADVGLNAASPSGPIGSASPGYALLDRGGLHVGDAARAASRLRPRHTSSRFWDRLDQRPVGRPFPRALTHADLVCAHLRDYWSELRESLGLGLPDTSVLLVVPSAYSEAQLSLLLGIARACDIPVTGLVDTAVAALENAGADRRILHVDVQLHRAVVTLLDAGSKRVRQAVESVDAAGLVAFHNAWAAWIAARFVRETRFDPLHGAASEQSLYDELPGWLGRESTDDGARFSIEVKGQRRTIEADPTQATEAIEAQLAAIRTACEPHLNGSPVIAAVSPRAARIPGLADRLEELTGSRTETLLEGSATAGALKHRALIERPGLELPLVLGLPSPERHG